MKIIKSLFFDTTKTGAGRKLSTFSDAYRCEPIILLVFIFLKKLKFHLIVVV